MNFGSGFNSTNPSAFTPQTSGPFGTSNVFGSSPSPGGFGSATGTSLFNASPSTPPTAGGLFGGSNTGSQMFGAFGQQQNRSFGGGQSSTPFGGTGSSFSVQASTSGVSPDGSQGTYGRAFERVPESTEPGARDATKAFLMTISAMQDFRFCQPEMLRAADYKKGHKRSSGQVQTPSPTATGVFGNTGGGFGSASNPQGTGSSGFGSGFRPTTSFGGGSTGIFGQTTPQASGGFGAFGSSGGTTFGQTPNKAFGSSFSSGTSPSIFGSSTGFGQQSTPSMFGNQQPQTSIFGNQSTTPAFGSSFGQQASTGGGLFGQSTGGSVFAPPSGQSTGFTSTGFGGGGGLFSSQMSTGFQFGSSPSPGLFGNNPATGTSIFSQPSTGGGAFGQSSQPLFLGAAQTQNQGQSGGLFGVTHTPTGNNPLFGQVQPTQQQVPAQGGYFGNQPWASDPSTKPNWMPEYGLVVPDPSKYLQFGVNGDTTDRKVNTYDYMRREREKHFADRFVSIPVRVTLDEAPTQKKDEKKPDIGWDSFALSRPTKKTLEDEVKQSIANFYKSTEDAGLPSSGAQESSSNSGFSFLTPSKDALFDQNVQTLMKLEEERRARMQSVDGMSIDEVRALLPMLTRSNYYIVPTLNGLEHLVNVHGKDALKSVPGVEIGREEYGKVCFAVPVNLEKLKINDAIAIKRGRVEPMSDDSPLSGVAATITLFKVFSKDKGKDGFLKSGSEFAHEIDRFKKHTRQINGEFVSYDRYGTWIFKVTEIGQ